MIENTAPSISSSTLLCSLFLFLLTVLLPAGALPAPTQEATDTGIIRGSVSLGEGGAVAGATVLIIELGRSVRTDDDGAYALTGVPAGTYRLLATREGLGSLRRSVTVEPDATATADFVLELATASEEVTVTANAAGETTTFDAFNPDWSVSGNEMRVESLEVEDTAAGESLPASIVITCS